MKYFIDTEFIEGFHKPLFGRRRHFIDLVSIGIVAEDGRTYYAISKEFEPKKASEWVQDNVLYPIMRDHGYSKTLSYLHGHLSYHPSAIKDVQKHYGKTNAVIAQEVADFIQCGLYDVVTKITRADAWQECFYKEEFAYIKKHNTFIPKEIYNSGTDGKGAERNFRIIYNQPEFYGYYADYDWVLFCSLYGRMIDLPKGFPMYCKDLKQMVDDKADHVLHFGVGTHSQGNKWYPYNMQEAIKWVKDHPLYPKQKDEHNALADAKWNKELFDFLERI